MAVEPLVRPRILYVDAFDSFTNNIIGLLEHEINAEILLVRIDDQHVAETLESFITRFDAVVIGPGPGHPENSQDVGFIPRLFQLSEEQVIPIFGICLGFQSLCHANGAEVRRLRQPRHGIVSTMEHKGENIFQGLGKDALDATMYHSLFVDLGEDMSWKPTRKCPHLYPLGWDTSDASNGPILMGAVHTEKPFWGVQFHPESICTSQAGRQLVRHWWEHAQKWLQEKGRWAARHGDDTAEDAQEDLDSVNGHQYHSTSHLATTLKSIIGEGVHLRWGTHQASTMDAADLVEMLGYNKQNVLMLDSQGHKSGQYSILGLITPGKTLHVTYRVSTKTLRYGITKGEQFTQHLDGIDEIWPLFQEAIDLHDPRDKVHPSRASTPGADPQIFGLDRFTAGHLPEGSPFWGGFIGYISYEAGLETIDVPLTPEAATGDVPDVHFTFVHRSIVIDHESGSVYIQSLLPGDWTWILDVGRVLDERNSKAEILLATPPESPQPASTAEEEAMPVLVPHYEKALRGALSLAEVKRPEEQQYRQKVLDCQQYLSAGDSYELCLTDQSKVSIPKGPGGKALDEWLLYRKLRANNPAPFGSFIRVDSLNGSGRDEEVVIVSSSPERFLRWTRDGKCQFRPIKGTVKKGPNVTSQQAHEILNSSKERAENLMIVDLIRHDLSGVIGASNTWVSKLMVVEEYETVYQLVSVIEGQLRASSDKDHCDTGATGISNAAVTGLQVLEKSLPPGSMTGAPKKRSCEILQRIEKRPRGIYSGVLGYMDVGGGGDFSVVIRTAVKAQGGFDASTAANDTTRSTTLGGKKGTPASDPSNHVQCDTYNVGAGGAITIQSTDLGEFLEMETKADSVLRSLFR